MKKILLFIAIALAASGLAQQRNNAASHLDRSSTTDVIQANCAAPERPHYLWEPEPQNGYAYYYRPAGSFYQCLSANLYLMNSAPLVTRPYQTATYTARGANKYDWSYQQSGTWFNSSGNQELDVFYGCEVDSMPKLKIAPGNVFDGDYIGGSWGLVHAVPDPIAYLGSIVGGLDFYVSPKCYSGHGRDGSCNRYKLGAPDYPGGQYGNGYIGGNLLGNNASGYDSVSLWIEAPKAPYLLRGLLVLGYDLLVTDTVDIDVIVRKVVKDNESDMITPGDFISKTSFAVDKSMEIWTHFVGPDGDSVRLWYADQTWPVIFENPLVIDSEVLITLTGYNHPNVLDFGLYTIGDGWNEGFGDHGYIYNNDLGWMPLNTQHTGVEERSTAPSIFMDVKFPYTMLWDEEDMGVRQVGGAGGILAVELKSSDPGSEQQVAIESTTPGSDDASWLTVGFTDGEVSELGEHRLTANLDVAANTAGTPRSARVTITMPASPTVTLVVNQTDGVVGDVTGDGTVDISDVNAVINVMLGKAEPIPAADVTGDGTVDIADVNAVINIMLGK